MFSAKSSKPVFNPWRDDHPEKLGDKPMLTGFANQLKGLVSPTSMLDQIFGVQKTPESHYKPTISEKKISRQETVIFSLQATQEDKKIQMETAELVQQLKHQVTLLEKSEKTLTKEIAKIKVEQLPAKTGIYYLRFLEWMIMLVRQLRQRVEDGRAWLSTFQKRQKKRLGYWKMYKKHGTTFGLSHERTLATQTG